MLTSISLSNKGNIITYKNSTNNNNSDKAISGDNGNNNNDVNKGYNAKIIYT